MPARQIESDTAAPVTEPGMTSKSIPANRRLLALEVLKISNFRFLLASDFFQMISFNTRLMVQGWIVLELTNSDGWVGLVAGLPTIPVIALALFGGAISDRVNRRVLQLWTFSLLALSGYVLGYLVQSDSIQLWHLVAMSFPVALLATLRMTAGSAMVVDVVGRERIFGANALSTALGNVGRFVEPGIGGWVLANHGSGIAFYGIGTLLLFSAGLMWFVKVENPVASESKKSLVEDTKLGIRYISGGLLCSRLR
jgi:MFS family permease